MNKYIRMPGLILFVSLTVLIVGGTVFFAESLIKSIAESKLSDANGAKVDVEEVILRWSPFKLTLNNIEVADKQNPMRNLVQIAETSFALSVPDLFLSKIIIEEMSVLGVEPDTARTSSGEISHEEVTEDTDVSVGAEKNPEQIKMPSVALPDIKELLKIEPLTSTVLFKDLNSDLDKTNSSWEAIDTKINDASRWKAYDEKYDQIKKALKGNVKQQLEAIKSAKELSRELQNEGKQFKEAHATFKTDLDRLEIGFKKAKAAPAEDYKRLKEKANLDDMSPENISQMVFGPQVAEYITLASKWYTRVEPYLADEEEDDEVVERSKGKDIRFEEFDPRPDYFIRLAKIDVHTPRGRYAGSITDVSSEQNINKKPMRLALSAEGMDDRKAENISAEFNYVDKGKGFTKVDYSIDQQKIQNFKISSSESLKLVMAKSLMDMSFSAVLKNGRVDGKGRFDFNAVAFESNKKQNDSSFSSMLSDSFSDIDQFDIRLNFRGSLRNLNVGIKSNIDDQLGKQLKQRFNDKKKQYESDLKTAIEEKYKEPLAKIEAQRNKLSAIKKKVSDKEDDLKQKLAALEQSISSQANAKKKKLDVKKKAQQDKLKNKLKQKLKLF